MQQTTEKLNCKIDEVKITCKTSRLLMANYLGFNDVELFPEVITWREIKPIIEKINGEHSKKLSHFHIYFLVKRCEIHHIGKNNERVTLINETGDTNLHAALKAIIRFLYKLNQQAEKKKHVLKEVYN